MSGSPALAIVVTMAAPASLTTQTTKEPAKALSTISRAETCEVLPKSLYAEWDRFVEASPHGTVFHFSWWLTITADSFRLLVARDERGRIIAGMPLPEKRRAGLRLLHSPVLTPYLGPIFDLAGVEGNCERLRIMRQYGELLARNLGTFDSFRCVAGASGPDLQGFLWAGFQACLGYTFRFDASQAIADIQKGITRTHAQKLSKAKRLNLKVEKDFTVDVLLELNKLSFARKATTPPYTDETVRRLWHAATQRGMIDVYRACTAEGRPIASLFTVHDSRTTYQIISGFDPAFLDLPGQNCLLWTAAVDALAAGRHFDFEGSSIRGVETFYRRWGASAMPVWKLQKHGSLRGRLIGFALNYGETRTTSPPPPTRNAN